MTLDERFQTHEEFLRDFRRSSLGMGVAGRAKVGRLAGEDPEQALTVAREIEHPWYRCQAISSIVEAHPEHHLAEALLEESLAAAYSQTEPNRVASVSFWPLKLLAGMSPHLASEHTQKLLGVIAREPHGLRRLDGLMWILQAVMPVKQLREAVLVPFTETAKLSRGWRTERIINDAVEFMAPFDRAAAKELLDSRPITKYTKSSRRLLSEMNAK